MIQNKGLHPGNVQHPTPGGFLRAGTIFDRNYKISGLIRFSQKQKKEWRLDGNRTQKKTF
jgi:hypothetical protein